MRTLYIPIGCGECIECLQRKSREWQVRLQEDIKTHRTGKFTTLTFSNESIAKLRKEYPKLNGYILDNQIATRALRLFNERYRKKYNTALRHWFITELGHKGTENIHMHGIVWTTKSMDEIEERWQYGHIWKYKIENHQKVNYVSARTVNYMTKYVTKRDYEHKHYKPIILTSPGIGRDYTKSMDFIKNKFKGEQTNEAYKTSTGHKMPLPIYWRNKIYNEEEREILWIQKLNQQMRYVLGQEISIKEGEQTYINIRNAARELNNRLGYGSGSINIDELEQEEIRRNMLTETRIINARRKASMKRR